MMKITTHEWARNPKAEVSTADAIYGSLVSDDHGIDPGQTAENVARAVAIITQSLTDRGLLEVEDVAMILNGRFRIE